MTNIKRLSLTVGVSLTAALLLSAAAPASKPYSASPPARHQGIQLAGLFGESEEEKAERLAREQKEADQEAAIANLNAQVRELQDTVRRLTGQNEVLSHKVDQFDARVDRMQKDFDYKLCNVMAQQVGGDPGSLPCAPDSGSARTSYAPAPSSQTFSSSDASASSAPRTLAPPPGVLGTLSSSSSAPAPKPSSGVPDDTAAAAASPYRAEFDAALNQLGKAQYDGARAAFRAFADNHPKDDLTPQAVFWVGNIAYVQKDYPGAARAFAEEIKKYPSNSRAPESMLKLGQSLIAMGQKKEGCFTLGSLPATYPKASKTTIGQAATAKTAAGCK